MEQAGQAARPTCSNATPDAEAEVFPDLRRFNAPFRAEPGTTGRHAQRVLGSRRRVYD